MARKTYSEPELDDLRKRGKDVIFSIDTEDETGTRIEAFDMTDEDKGCILYADIPKGEGFTAFEVIEVGDHYHDQEGDLKKDILLSSALNRSFLTNWIVNTETSGTIYKNSRIIRL